MGYIKTIREKIGHDRLIVVGGGVFITDGRRVLLQRRIDNGCWAQHGGGMEIGEEIEDTARRELLEETGLVAGEMKLLGVFSGEDMLYTYPNGDMVCVVAVCYVCSDFTGKLLPQTDETAELRWFDFDEIPDNISPPDRRPMNAFIRYMEINVK